ncbi:hypothetical protein AB0J71_24055 [Nonomuraea sp. NPDC049637]|uniref:hypothetical protein n=1 Tax=Nonomuraea sp. NPDC049637 TaxID=3154356 RepID=UPI00341EFBC9
MIDIVNQVNATRRETGNRPVAVGEGRSLLLKDNARGEILRREKPHLIKVTRMSGKGMPTEVEAGLAPGGDGGGTVLELEHAAPQAARGTGDDGLAAAVAFAVQHFAPESGRDGDR